jgi:hypothetical protein
LCRVPEVASSSYSSTADTRSVFTVGSASSAASAAARQQTLRVLGPRQLVLSPEPPPVVLPKDAVDNAIRSFKAEDGFRVVPKVLQITKAERRAGLTGDPKGSSWVYDNGVCIELDPARFPNYNNSDAKRKRDRWFCCKCHPTCRMMNKPIKLA